MLPPASTSTPYATSSPVPPNGFDQRYVPDAEYLRMKKSTLPALVIIGWNVGPSATVDWNERSTDTLVWASIAAARPTSRLGPYSVCAHAYKPVSPSYLATNTSANGPLLCTRPPPKSALPVKYPVTITSPL